MLGVAAEAVRREGIDRLSGRGIGLIAGLPTAGQGSAYLASGPFKFRLSVNLG